MGWLTLCKKDPLLELIQHRLGRANLLRRPVVDLQPLDVYMLLEDGWFAPPQLVRVGSLRDLLAPKSKLEGCEPRRGPSPNISASQSGGVKQSIGMEVLKFFAEAAGIASPGFQHDYAGQDSLHVSLNGVIEASCDLTLINAQGRSIRLNREQPALQTALANRAKLLLVDTVLYTSGIRLDSVARRALSYSIQFDSDTNAGWKHDEETGFHAQADTGPLAFAFNCVQLLVRSDGKFEFAAGPQGRSLDATVGGAPFEPAQVWPEGVACELGPYDTENTRSESDAAALAPVPAMLQRSWPNASLAPGWDAGTTDLKLGPALVGLAFVDKLNGALSEDTLTDEAESGYRRAHGGAQQSAVGSEKNSGAKFTSRADFQSTAWSQLGWPEGTRGLYQRARNTTKQYTRADALAACNQLVTDMGAIEEVVQMDGVQSGNAAVPASGYVFFGPQLPNGLGETKRKIWQVVPGSMALPPNQPVNLHSLTAPVGIQELLAAFLQAVDDSDTVEIVTCECLVRLVKHSWQLRNADLP